MNAQIHTSTPNPSTKTMPTPQNIEQPQASDINTNVRLFDLVRYMRSELYEAELITDQEYAWLCAEAPMAKGQGSPSPRRLEDYDEIRAKMKHMEKALTEIREMVGGDPTGKLMQDEVADRVQKLVNVLRETVGIMDAMRALQGMPMSQPEKKAVGMCYEQIKEMLERAMPEYDAVCKAIHDANAKREIPT
jgi:hypothetical protein